MITSAYIPKGATAWKLFMIGKGETIENKKNINHSSSPNFHSQRNTQITCILNISFQLLLCSFNDLPDSFARKEEAILERKKVTRKTSSKSLALPDAVTLRREQEARSFPKTSNPPRVTMKTVVGVSVILFPLFFPCVHHHRPSPPHKQEQAEQANAKQWSPQPPLSSVSPKMVVFGAF